MVELSWGAQRTENWGWKTFWQPKDSSLSPLRSIGHPECTLQIVACMCRESVPWLYIAPWCICSCWGPSGLSSSYLPVHSRQHCQAVMNLLFFFFAVNAHYFLSFKLNSTFNFAWICHGHLTVNYIKIVLMLSRMVFSYCN